MVAKAIVAGRPHGVPEVAKRDLEEQHYRPEHEDQEGRQGQVERPHEHPEVLEHAQP